MFARSLLAIAASAAFVGGCAAQVAADCNEDPDAAGCVADPDATGEDLESYPARLFVDPPFGVGFTCVHVGCADSQSVMLTNLGKDSDVKITQVRPSIDSSIEFTTELFTGSGSPITRPNVSQPLVLEADETVELRITYVPTDAVVDTGTIWIDWYDSDVDYADAVVQRVEYPVTTQVLGDPIAELVTTELNYGHVSLGETKVMTIEITNQTTGNAPLALELPVLSGDSSPVFRSTAAGAVYVNPGETAELEVEFTPNAVDAFFGVLYIPTNDPGRPQVSVPLVGTAIEQAWMDFVSPENWVADFGQTRIGDERTREVTIRNLGGLPLLVTPHLTDGIDVGFGTDASIDVQLPAINPLDELTFEVTVAPAMGGELWGQMTFDSNDPTLPFDWIDLVAFGIAPDASFTSGELDFGNIVQSWISEAQSVSISNAGTGEMTISQLEWEVGSSTQVKLVSMPALPVKLAGDDTLDLAIYVEALNQGPANAVLLVHTDSIEEPVRRITVTANVVSCEEGCPVANGTPFCGAGSCQVSTCYESFHDADEGYANGCECSEDAGGDIGGACFDGANVGPLGDNCSDYQQNTTRSGTLHDLGDSDLFTFYAQDAGSAFCDTFGDSFEVRVEFLQSVPGLEFCYRYGNDGCGGFNQASCGHTSAANFAGGSYGSDDNTYVTVWVQWSPGAAPMCGNYQIRFRADNN